MRISGAIDMAAFPGVPNPKLVGSGFVQIEGELTAEDSATLVTWALERGFHVDTHRPRIFDFVCPGDADRPVQTIDYKRGLTTRLQPFAVLRAGHIDRVLFFAPEDITAEADGFGLVEGATPIVSEHRTYVDGPLGPATRDMVVRWYDANGDVVIEKTMAKGYTPSASVADHPALALQPGESLLDEGVSAGKLRRSNVFAECAQLAATAAGAHVALGNVLDEGSVVGALQGFLSRHQVAVDLFIDSANPGLVADIGDDVSAWLDAVVRPDGTTGRQAIVGAIEDALEAA